MIYTVMVEDRVELDESVKVIREVESYDGGMEFGGYVIYEVEAESLDDIKVITEDGITYAAYSFSEDGSGVKYINTWYPVR